MPPAADPLGRRWQVSPFAIRLLQYPLSFWGIQSGKLRDCGDLKHSMTNLSCTPSTPTQLVSWGHMARLSQLLVKEGGDWALTKAGHEAACKQLPIEPRDQRHVIVALRRPRAHTWRGFATRALIAGSIDAVLHYNVLRRIISTLVNRFCGIPMLCYFYDFAAAIRKFFGGRALRAFARFCSFLGITLTQEESEVGNEAAFLGMMRPSPSSGNRRNFRNSPSVKEKYSTGPEGRISSRNPDTPQLP